MKKLIYYIIGTIALLCIILSILIQIEKLSFSNNNPVSWCSVLPGSNCEAVQTSIYSDTFGISNPYYGIVGFGIIFILSIFIILSDNSIEEDDGLRLASYIISMGGIVAGAIAIRFLYIQAFVLHTYCILCVITDILSLALLAFSVYIVAKLQTNH